MRYTTIHWYVLSPPTFNAFNLKQQTKVGYIVIIINPQTYFEVVKEGFVNSLCP